MITRIIKDPLTVFAFLAFAIFALNWMSSATSNSNTLQINQADIDARILLNEISRGEAMTAAMREEITQAYIEEQILVAEAMALGLDKDSRIHDMLAQKMRHVLSADVIQPTQEELATFYGANIANYEQPATVSLEELVLDDVEAPPTYLRQLFSNRADIAAVITALENDENEPEFSAGRLNAASAVDIENIFSAGFSALVFSTPERAWAGPFISNRGQHWLLLVEKNPGETPPLDEIIDRVRLDWIAAAEEQRLNEEISRLSAEYQVEIVSDAASHD